MLPTSSSSSLAHLVSQPRGVFSGRVVWRDRQISVQDPDERPAISQYLISVIDQLNLSERPSTIDTVVSGFWNILTGLDTSQADAITYSVLREQISPLIKALQGDDMALLIPVATSLEVPLELQDLIPTAMMVDSRHDLSRGLLLEMGKIDQMIDDTKQVSDSQEREKTLLILTYTLLRRDKMDLAEPIAKILLDHRVKQDMLAVFIKKHKIQRAIDFAKEISDDEFRSTAFKMLNLHINQIPDRAARERFHRISDATYAATLKIDAPSNGSDSFLKDK
jgi:hypothetical protein